jgi:pyrroline-5-carboxylate reductase
MIGFIGGGNMAEALIKGMYAHGKRVFIVSEPIEERRRYLEKAYAVKTTASNREVVKSSSIIVLAIKPQTMDGVLSEIADIITEEKTVVSIAAGITLAYLQSRLKTTRLVRVMPNTPALVQQSISVISLCSCLPEKIIAPVRDIFMSIGKVLTLPEHYMNAVTALSGSGPGFIAYIVECLIEAGVKTGLQEYHAAELAVQTLCGTAHLLETGIPPEKLRFMVTSPGGTTAAGLTVFEERGLRTIIVDALHTAMKRAEELGRSV